MYKKFIALTALALASAATPAMASVTVGDADGGNCYPFSCGPSDGLTEYLQLYMASAFVGGTTFNAVSFDAWPYNGSTMMDSATYTVSFYATANGTLSGDMASNAASYLGTLGTFKIGGAMPNVLTLSGSAITYDPTLGNLLMDVVITDPTVVAGYYQSYFVADYSPSETFRAGYAVRFGQFDGTSGAMQTTFSAVPEPATWALMALGFAALGAAACGRRNGALAA